MKPTHLSALLFSLIAALAPAAIAASPSSSPASTSQGNVVTGKAVPASQVEAAWLAKARESYPLKTCIISGEELGGMGIPAEYVYQVPGQPDRLVRFCCSSCLQDFLKAPEAALAKLYPAAAAPSPHSDHSHHAH